ncbi:rod shape-determining protein RodA [Cytophagaceae bacterium ABcell3]|nr:rod shape-determining protein RodA [Cytophagaceae bacterium ABcell3]
MRDNLSKNIDWLTIALYATFVTFGWFNIFAAVYDHDAQMSIFDFSINSGKQLMWIGIATLLIFAIFIIDYKFYSSFAFFIYGAVIVVLVLTCLFAPDIKGSRSWLVLGPIRLQPAEFAKLGTALAISSYLGQVNMKLSKFKTQRMVAFLILLPSILILLQNETGTVLVFSAFVLVLYREGLSPVLLVAGIGCVVLFVVALVVEENLYIVFALLAMTSIFIISQLYKLRKRTLKRLVINRILIAAGLAVVSIGVVYGTDFFVNDVLQPHQQARIKALLDPESDPQGFGWNVIQSKTAIGSGGFAGKGFLQGTQTKFDFVPEQSTDFIFCTIGEEHGWIGSSLLIALYVVFLCRLVFLAERQKDKFSRIFGYSVASIIFFHFMVNIGMTIGVFPIIGIPLPFFSYGGSSLLSFTMLLFIFLKLDSHRKQVLSH